MSDERRESTGKRVEPAFLVCERKAYWAPLLRRLAPRWLASYAGKAPHDVGSVGNATCLATVWEARTWETCWERMTECPQHMAILAVESSSLENALERLRRLRGHWPQAAVAAVVPPMLRWTRWSLREAGAVTVASTALELRPVVRIAARHWTAHKTTMAEVTTLPTLDTCIQKLPW